MFTSRSVTEALGTIPDVYDEMVFFIADRLQIFNRAERCRNGNEMAREIRWFETEAEYLAQRKVWLRRLRVRDSGRAEWRVVSTDSLCDAAFATIHRNLRAMYCVVDAFRMDVDETSRRHVSGREPAPRSVEAALRLSREYVLEEIAANIRMRVGDDVEAEYYLGSYPTPLLGLYGGKYKIDVHTLAGLGPKKGTYKFFTWRRSDQMWVEIA